ncbi:zinc finger, CCHC-type containing protein [Tanacetum coccineum]
MFIKGLMASALELTSNIELSARAAAIKHMPSNFAKLEKCEGVDFRRWHKKMHFLLSIMSVVYVLTTPMLKDGDDNPTDSLEAKYIAEDALSKKFLVSWKWISEKRTKNQAKNDKTEHGMEKHICSRFNGAWYAMEGLGFSASWEALGKESLQAQDSNKPKGNNVAGPSVVNVVEHNNPSRNNENRGKRKHHDTKANPNKKLKVTCWKCGKPRHLKRMMMLRGGLTQEQLCMLNIVSDDIGSTFMSTSKLNDSILWYARLGHVHFKRMQNMSKDRLIPSFDMDTKKCKTCMLIKITKKPFQNVKRKTEVLELIYNDLCDLHATPSLGNKKYFVTFIDDASRFCNVYLLNSKDEALDKFKVLKTKVELQQGSLIKRFKTDREREYIDTLYFQSVGIIHEMTALYTPQQNSISERKNRVQKEIVNSMLSYSWPSQGAVVRLLGPKLKNLGKRGIECIFIGYAKHSMAFRFYVTEPNESIIINSIIKSRDAILDENIFSSVPKPSQRSLVNGTEDSGGLVFPKEVNEEVVQQPKHELRKRKRHRTLKDLGPKFQLYLIKGTRDLISDQHSYCFNVDDDPKTFDEAMKSQDVAFWKEAINDEMDSIIGNNTWVLADLPPGFIICLYVDDMLIFGTDQVYVDLTKDFLSSRFSMKDIGEADVILVSTPMDTCEKLMPNNGQVYEVEVHVLEWSEVVVRLFGCL